MKSRYALMDFRFVDVPFAQLGSQSDHLFLLTASTSFYLDRIELILIEESRIDSNIFITEKSKIYTEYTQKYTQNKLRIYPKKGICIHSKVTRMAKVISHCRIWLENELQLVRKSANRFITPKMVIDFYF